MGIIIAISYIFTVLFLYTILRFIKTDEDAGLHVMYSILWPTVVVTLIILGPFYLIDKLAKRSKRNKK